MSRGTAIKRESAEALRARLLADEQVHTMIEMRAYEIYRLRGGAPGQEAEDWLQAEAEILKFLMEEEARRSETEALVAQSLANDLNDQSYDPIQNAAAREPRVGHAITPPAQTSAPAAERSERAPLGLADILAEGITSVGSPGEPAPDLAKPRKARSRTTSAKTPVARKEGDEKPRGKARSKEKTSKKSSKEPKNS
jgi:hypothetical protein